MKNDLVFPTEPPEAWEPTRPEGLTAEEAAQRAKDGLDNKCKVNPGKNVWQILASNLFTLFNLLNVALALCLAAVGSYRNMLFLGVVISNTLIGTVQELRAHRTISRLKLLNTPAAHVLRDGNEMTCNPEALVKGDLVILRTGDQVPADAIVTEGTGATNESLLTGESDPVHKTAGAWLMSGSYVSEGGFTAQLAHVGEESYVNRLTRSAKSIKRPKSELMTSLQRIIRVVSAALVPLGVLLFCKQYCINGAPLEKAVPMAVAAMIGMIPEGLMLLTSVALAVGVVKLGRKGTLVQELYGIETLARADVLCLDKTGTLTTGEMALERFVPMEADEATMRETLGRFLGAFDICSGTLGALRQAVEPSRDKPTAVLPFSSERKKSAASFADGVTYVLGAPSFVLGEGYRGDVRATAESMSAEGLRVLALCSCEGEIQGEELPEVKRVLGLCVLHDTLRGHVKDTLAYFRRQGVEVKIISGDDPRTVSAVAGRAGLESADRWLDVSQVDDETLQRRAADYAVFGRVTPQRKKLLVQALKKAGHSVAMTGDGVNDIPALKAADCSIAIAGGADAVGQAAQLTLLNADFSRLPQIVDEGRRVVNNITRAASLFLVKTLYSFVLSALLLALPATYPFQPIQLTFISTLTIGIPTFFLALEPNHERIRGSFIRTVLLHAVPGAAAVAVCATSCMMLEHLGIEQAVCSTLATLSAGMIGLLVLCGVCYPFSRMRLCVLAVMTAGFVLGAMLLGEVFYLTPLGWPMLLCLAGLTAGGAGILWLLTWLLRKELNEKTPAF